MGFGNVRNIWRITGSASLFGCLLIAVRQVSGSSPQGENLLLSPVCTSQWQYLRGTVQAESCIVPGTDYKRA